MTNYVIDKEPNKRSLQVKKAIWIRKTKAPLNRDEGSYPTCAMTSFDISTEEVSV